MDSYFLEGDSVGLRPHEELDLKAWASWFNDPLVTEYMEQAYFPNTVILQSQRLHSLYENQNQLQLAVVEKKSGDLVGTVGLHQINLINKNADCSIVIGNRKYWGKGLGREAVKLIVKHGFEKLNLHKITAGMVDLNVRSTKLFETLGFEKEALLKEHLFIKGHYRGLIRMALFSKAGSA